MTETTGTAEESYERAMEALVKNERWQRIIGGGFVGKEGRGRIERELV